MKREEKQTSRFGEVKMQKLIKVLSITTMIALTLSLATVLNAKTVEAKKSVVKSLKVKGASKNISLKVGDKKIYKVKVKAKKKKTAFIAKSSNAGVVSASKKGKQVTLTAKKVGKAKVTIYAKYNKKKKFVINVNVSAKKKAQTSTAKKTTKPSVPVETTVAPKGLVVKNNAQDVAYAYKDDEYSKGSSEIIPLSVTGGSGNYRCYVQSGSDSVFSSDNIESGSGNYIARFRYNVDTPGTYNASIKVVDVNNSELFTTFNYKLEVKKYLKVSGRITNADSKPIASTSVYASGTSEDLGTDSGKSDAQGKYALFVKPGKYNFHAMYFGNTKAISNRSIQADTTLDIVFDNLYKVTLTSNDMNASEIGDWYYKDDTSRSNQVAAGAEFFLSVGTHQLTTEGYRIDGNKLDKYTASITIKIDDKDVTANVQTEIVDSMLLSGKIEKGSNEISGLGKDYKRYYFVAPEDGTYVFEGDFNGEDSEALLRDNNYNIIASDDDSGIGRDFKIEKKLEAGKTYFLEVKAYAENPLNGDISIYNPQH